MNTYRHTSLKAIAISRDIQFNCAMAGVNSPTRFEEKRHVPAEILEIVSLIIFYAYVTTRELGKCVSEDP